MTDPASSKKFFEAGNYAAVAMDGSPEAWETQASLGLVGKTKEAIEALKTFGNAEALFYRAVIHWVQGDDEQATHLLKPMESEYAKNLLRLIQKPQIQVLAQVVSNRCPPWDLLTPAQREGKFRIQNISYHPEDMRNEPYADIRQYYTSENPPDFYLCNIGLEPILVNLQELPCPILGQTGDHDMHIQSIYPWLRLFDGFIVNDPTEWNDIHRLTDAPVLTFPKTHGLGPLPPVSTEPRDIDVFVSGSWMHSFHPDKVRVLHQVLPMSDHHVLLLHGFMPGDMYNRMLARSKVSFTFVRFKRALSTRGLDALAMGCALVVQKNSMIALFAGKEEGVLTYDSDGDDLESTIRTILREWPAYELRARRGAEIIRQEFSMPRLVSQYLRFATFLAAKPRKPRKKQPTEDLVYKRNSLFIGGLPYETLREEGITRLEKVAKKKTTPSHFLDMARELVVEYGAAIQNRRPLASRELLIRAWAFYEEGLKKFPKSLVLHYNWIRTLLHFGKPDEMKKGISLLKAGIEKPESYWEIDPDEDVFPFDFGSTFFNYRTYLEAVTRHHMEGTDVRPLLVRLILASLHYYLGRCVKTIDSFEKAVTLDGEFPHYSLTYAQELVSQGSKDACQKATRLLVPLALSSTVFLEAYELLRQVEAKHPKQFPEVDEIRATRHPAILNYFHILQGFLCVEALELPSNSESSPREETAVSAQVARVQRSRNLGNEVSIILPVLGKIEQARHCIERILEVTEGQNHELIVVENRTEGHISSSFKSLDGVVRVIQSDQKLWFSRACNLAAREASGKYLVFMRGHVLPEKGWLESLLHEVRSNEEVAVVGSKLVTLDGRIDHAGLVFSRILNQPTFVYKGVSADDRAVNYLREFQAVEGAGMLVRQEAFRAVGGFDEKYVDNYEDFDLCLRIRQRGGHVVYQPASVLYNLDYLGRLFRSLTDLEYFGRTWKDKFLTDEDAVYLRDGYLARHWIQNGYPAFLLEPVTSEKARAEWLLVAAAQQLAQVAGVQAIQPILLQPEAWPDDAAVLEWGAKLCELAGIPQQSKAFLERSLENRGVLSR